MNLLPHHVFTPTHEIDYRDLNWQSREAMMMLLSQIKIQQQDSSANMKSNAAAVGMTLN
jgi:hypothetical protein